MYEQKLTEWTVRGFVLPEEPYRLDCTELCVPAEADWLDRAGRVYQQNQASWTVHGLCVPAETCCWTVWGFAMFGVSGLQVH